MFTKHFLKTLMIFMALIILGLIGVSIVSYFSDKSTEADSGVNSQSVQTTDNTSS